MTATRRAVAEVEDLHAFFTGWYGGALPNTEPAFARLDLVLAPGFELTTSDGIRIARRELVSQIRAGHASGPVTIWIEDARARELGERLVLVTYEEWQDRGDGPRGRVSSAVLRDMPDLPHDMQWQFVHETWLRG